MKIKLLNSNSKQPIRANASDAGLDLFAQENYIISQGKIYRIVTGIAVEIPFGCVGIIKDRSSKAIEGLHILGGVIDSGYTGEIIVIATNLNNFESIHINHGDKIAQLLILPLAPLSNIEIVKKLSKSDRGEKGFGSSDKIIHAFHHWAGELARTLCGIEVEVTETTDKGGTHKHLINCEHCLEVM